MTLKVCTKILFEYIYDDYFVAIEEFLNVEYEFDFTFLGQNDPKITNDDIYLIFDNIEVNSVMPSLIGIEGDDLISLEDLGREDKNRALDLIETNLNGFIQNLMS